MGRNAPRREEISPITRGPWRISTPRHEGSLFDRLFPGRARPTLERYGIPMASSEEHQHLVGEEHCPICQSRRIRAALGPLVVFRMDPVQPDPDVIAELVCLDHTPQSEEAARPRRKPYEEWLKETTALIAEQQRRRE